MESPKFHQYIKIFSKWPLATMILFFGAASGTFWVWKGRPAHLNAQRQRARIESLAYQVLEIRRQSLRATRGPASVARFEGTGRVGTDLDGKPYFYELAEENSSWVVRLWSERDASDPTEVRIRKDQL